MEPSTETATLDCCLHSKCQLPFPNRGRIMVGKLCVGALRLELLFQEENITPLPEVHVMSHM